MSEYREYNEQEIYDHWYNTIKVLQVSQIATLLSAVAVERDLYMDTLKDCATTPVGADAQTIAQSVINKSQALQAKKKEFDSSLSSFGTLDIRSIFLSFVEEQALKGDSTKSNIDHAAIAAKFILLFGEPK